MGAEFTMQCKWDNSNLYIKAAGDFTLGAAEALCDVMLKQQNRVCRIFVDTGKLAMGEDAPAQYFRQALEQGATTEGQMFFKGKQGFVLAVDGCRVLLTKKKACQCKTPCAKCQCAERSQQRREAHGKHKHASGHEAGHTQGQCHCEHEHHYAHAMHG